MAKKPKNKNRVRDVNRLILFVAFSFFRLWFALWGVRVKTANKVGRPESPSMILCNHGSFLDFIYAGMIVGKYRPNFIAARLYFYHRVLGRLMRSVGAFPKSLFATDLENAKNCLTVLREKQHLGMMPEARLSTTGRFEDIQDKTISFIKKAGVGIYTIKINGGYLANPKWGNGLRPGARVEAEFDLLYTAQQVREMSAQELQQGIEERLGYNEFAWLAQHPEIHYRSRRLAEGLENILSVCPICHGKYTLTTKKNKIYCDHCGCLTSMDDRYGFDKEFRFQNLTQWYDWQKELLEKEILEDPNYQLSSPVELRLPGNGRGLTRQGGIGRCTLSREGLVYEGTMEGEEVRLHYPLEKIYRLPFGAGENFEVYEGSQIRYFVPEERRSAVEWYMASMILHDKTEK